MNDLIWRWDAFNCYGSESQYSNLIEFQSVNNVNNLIHQSIELAWANNE